eukprot:GHVT01062368.1.p1 GENE.GHVT01062368.1~~GHVT01062368.1.p1  ORF type:complete len:374 (+),score=60.79 GHVT01062368.1:2-1123(+)
MEDNSNPFLDDIRPSTIPANIGFFLVGIRLFNPIKQPTVTVSFARDVVDTTKPLWSETCSTPVRGSGGNWNYLHAFEFWAALPKRQHHQASLEVVLKDAADASHRGIAYVNLNCLLPWLDSAAQKEVAETFKVTTLEEVLVDEAEEARGDTDASGRARGTTSKAKKDNADDEETVDPTTGKKKASIYLPHNDADEANVSNEGVEDYCCDVEAPVDYYKRDITKKETAQKIKKYIKSGSSRMSLFDPKATTRFDSLMQIPSSAITDDRVRPKMLNMDVDDMHFDIAILEEGVEEEMRDEVPYELEADFDSTSTPYRRAPILVATDAGVPETVGYLKYVCWVIKEGDDLEVEKNRETCKKLRNRFEGATYSVAQS